jgi:hypothetical protein
LHFLSTADNKKVSSLIPATIKSRPSRGYFTLSESPLISDDYKIAIEGWKVRKDQLLRQRESVTRINYRMEKVNILSLLKQKNN